MFPEQPQEFPDCAASRPRPKGRAIFEQRAPARLLTAVLLAAFASMGADCAVFEVPPEGTLGEEGAVYFQPGIDAATSNPIMVGSDLTLQAVANKDEDVARVAAGRFVSVNSNIFEVVDAGPAGGLIRAVGAGTAAIEVHDEDGNRIDWMELTADVASHLEFLDAKLVGASVDARLPAVFAVLDGMETPLFVAAESSCGVALLAVNGLDVTSSDETILEVIPAEDGLGYILSGIDPGEVVVTVANSTGAVVEYEVEVADDSEVDDVRIVPSAAESPNLEVWGRTFVNGVEVIGVDYRWSSPNGRVTLNRADGPNIVATVTYPAEGEPEDTRPAEISASAFGEEDVVDAFSFQSTDLVGERVAQAEPETTSDGLSGCEGDSSTPATCGFLGFGVWSLRRLRRASSVSTPKGGARTFEHER